MRILMAASSSREPLVWLAIELNFCVEYLQDRHHAANELSVVVSA
jgi:hypothetical protein